MYTYSHYSIISPFQNENVIKRRPLKSRNRDEQNTSKLDSAHREFWLKRSRSIVYHAPCVFLMAGELSIVISLSAWQKGRGTICLHCTGYAAEIYWLCEWLSGYSFPFSSRELIISLSLFQSFKYNAKPSTGVRMSLSLSFCFDF